MFPRPSQRLLTGVGAGVLTVTSALVVSAVAQAAPAAPAAPAAVIASSVSPGPPTPGAATPGKSPSGCTTDPSGLSQAFSSWGDSSLYRLIAGSDFAQGAPGWTLSGGASIVAGGDPFSLTGSPTTNSVALPAGATAQSPFTCVDPTQPTFRVLDSADTSGATVQVAVVYQVSASQTVTVPVGTVTGASDWEPSAAFQSGAAIASAHLGGSAQMAVRFTGVTGTTQLDDLFVDPRMSWN